jgi:leader peptidase (prepilin peptidase)/N-methyltransferase
MDERQLETLHTIFFVVSGVVGAMLGSFLNVCVHRMPKGLSIVRPGSACPKCGTPIHWYDNIPVVSWVFLGAKCRTCRAPIHWQYPLVELLTCLLFLAVYWKFGMTLASPVYMALAAALVLVTFIDLADWTIPNEITFPGIPIGILCSVIAMLYPESGLLLDEPLMAFAGLVVGGGSLWLLDMISLLLLKNRGMGFGDVKLLAMLGAFFGPLGVLVIIVVASFFGSAIGITMILLTRGKPTDVPKPKEGEVDDDAMTPGGHYLPFGPYLVMGGLVYLFFGPEIVQKYLEYINVPGVMNYRTQHRGTETELNLVSTCSRSLCVDL